jgi:CheY-like chemotaxis protein
MKATLKGTALARLRHELRTPFNQLLGYTAILLEDADQGGFREAVPAVTGIQTEGRALLERIQTALPDSGGVSVEQLRALESEVRPEAERLLDASIALGVRLRDLKAADALADANRMSDALRKLLSVVQWVPRGSKVPEVQIAGRVEPVAPRALPEVAQALTGRLLIVEDDDANRDLLRRRLEREGHQVQEAGNGMQALQELNAGVYDLMLLDVIMPEMDGYELLARLKQNPALRDLPVVMISALDETQSMVRCIEMGAEDYLAKPFDPGLLRARIGESL